jgi:cell division initiation protein
MELTGRDIHEKQFHDAWRGYNQSEVDDFLDKVAEAVDRLQRENDDLRQRMQELDQAVAASRDTEEMLKKTLITAQRAAEEAIANAKQHAAELVAEAEERAGRMDTEARERLGQAAEEARRKNAELERTASERRRDLDARIEKLHALEADVRQRLKAFFDQQLRALETLSPAEATRGGPPEAGRAQPPAARPAAQPADARPHATPSVQPAQTQPGQTQSPWGTDPSQGPPGGSAGSPTSPVFEVVETADAQESEEEKSRRGVRDLFFRNQ